MIFLHATKEQMGADCPRPLSRKKLRSLISQRRDVLTGSFLEQRWGRKLGQRGEERKRKRLRPAA